MVDFKVAAVCQRKVQYRWHKSTLTLGICDNTRSLANGIVLEMSITLATQKWLTSDSERHQRLI